MNDIVYEGQENLVEEIERNGFFILKNFFKRESVIQVRHELVKILDKDFSYRKMNNINVSTIQTHERMSTLTEYIHDTLFPSFQCESFANLVDQLLHHETIMDFTEKVIGPNYRLRVDLFRRSSGIDDYVDDFELPHRWHRDSPGEFTFGFFLDDMEEHQCGGTAVISGTHWSAYNPLWDLMFSPQDNYTNYNDFINNNMQYSYIPEVFNHCAFFNNRLKKHLSENIREIRGRIGDIFFFVNDIWHGRTPNRTGKKLMLSRIGGFPQGFKFKDDLPLPRPHFPLPDGLSVRYEVRSQKLLDFGRPKTLLEKIRDNRHDEPLTLKAIKEKQVLCFLSKKWKKLSSIHHLMKDWGKKGADKMRTVIRKVI